MKKMYEGKHPEAADGWSVFGSFLDDQKTIWSMYVRDFSCGDEYVQMKVAAHGKADRKSNYWLSFKMAEARLCYGRELTSMVDHRPALYESLIQHLDKWSIQ